MSEIALILFLAVQVAGIAVFVAWLRDAGTPIPRNDPRYIFRAVHRDDRAAYRRIMRRSYAVAVRDLNRSINAVARQIGKALLPAMERLAAKLREVAG